MYEGPALHVMQLLWIDVSKTHHLFVFIAFIDEIDEETETEEEPKFLELTDAGVSMSIEEAVGKQINLYSWDVNN